MLCTNLNAQNLVKNGSFETTTKQSFFVCKPTYPANNVTSSNNTTIDYFTRDACDADYGVPQNWMGNENTAEINGNSYAGIIAYYGDECGIFKTKPGYQQYSEYLQMEMESPLVAGKSYTISFRNSLAEKSAYAVTGIGVYVSNEKVDVHNNAYLKLVPHLVTTQLSTNQKWETVLGTYIAKGGEKFLTIGCFRDFMVIEKIIPAFTNNSRKAYYYIDDVSVIPQLIKPEDLIAILYGTCTKLEELNFELGKAVILPESFEELLQLSIFLKTYPYLSVYLDGHTDKVGTDEFNQTLSVDRAESVKTYLTSHGVGGSRIKTRGFGSTRPIDSENINSLANRRVEITACE